MNHVIDSRGSREYPPGSRIAPYESYDVSELAEAGDGAFAKAYGRIKHLKSAGACWGSAWGSPSQPLLGFPRPGSGLSGSSLDLKYGVDFRNPDGSRAQRLEGTGPGGAPIRVQGRFDAAGTGEVRVWG